MKVSDVRTDKLLTSVLLAYTNPSFVADRILPTVPGLKDDTGDIPQLGTSHLRQYRSKRALYDQSQHRMEFSYSHDQKYSIEYYDLETYVPDVIINQQESPFNAERDGAIATMEALKLEREMGLAEAMTSTAILTNNTTLSGTSQLNDYANSDLASVAETARTSVQNKIGREANKVHMNRKVFNTLKNHPFFLEKVKNTSYLSGALLMQLMKDEWEVDEVIVGNAIYVNSKEGQTETKTQVWGNDIVFFYTPSAASLMAPSFGYNLQASSKPLRGTKRREPMADKGLLVGAEWGYQDLILDVNAAYLVKNAVA